VGRKALIVFACAWLLSLVTPVSAQGIIGRGWLERLSGPGPFTGLVLDARLVCLAEPVASRGNQTDNPFEGTLGGRLTYPKTLESRVWVTGAGCHFLPRDPDADRH
jgi:hypothetical protein